ncbi:MAG: putative zinc metalloprotease [Parcubacteria bacterium C7867-004]|nr:MAG: putative zinc metalloprotease [Parcubacteria bacterium C7867-004]
MQTFRQSLAFSLLLLIPLLLASVTPANALAQTEDEIKAQIEAQNGKIQQIEKEIAEYQKTLNVIGTQKQTLQSAIKTLDVSRQQTAAEINLTQNKISSTNLKLEKLSYDIEDTEQLIALDRRTLERSLRDMAEAGDISLIEQVFSTDSLTEAWVAVDDASAINSAMRESVANLSSAKDALTSQQEDVSAKKNDLTNLKGDLSNQKKTLDIAKSEKDKLLTQTKNQESTYQSIIAQKRAQQKAFEEQLSNLENSLKSVGQGAAPVSQTGILAWPFSASFAQSCAGKSGALGNIHCITQYFGNTAFATANAQIYNGAGHNAIDIGMPSGTPVLAALGGTVFGTGNTDSAPGCLSFGKWVVIKHANGLATLYSHLSSIGVSSGQAVTTGQVIGNSGMTGYATGPHLHFGVYVASGIQITTLGAFRGATTPCANAVMPVAPKDAYLNPMSYL